MLQLHEALEPSSARLRSYRSVGCLSSECFFFPPPAQLHEALERKAAQLQGYVERQETLEVQVRSFAHSSEWW